MQPVELRERIQKMKKDRLRLGNRKARFKKNFSNIGQQFQKRLRKLILFS